MRFSRCNRALYHILVNRDLFRPYDRGTADECDLFLEILDRDFRGTFSCHYCRRLHWLARENEYLTGEETYRRVSASLCSGGKDTKYNYGIGTTYHGHFVFEHTQMALKMHRRGCEAESRDYLRQLSLTESYPRLMASIPQTWGLYFFEPRVLDDEMFIRAQLWLYIPASQGCRLPTTQYMQVCTHLKIRSDDGNELVKILKCKLKHASTTDDSCSGCQNFIHCHHCLTEVHMEAKHLGREDGGTVLVVPKSMRLGPALSPLEAIWLSHLDEYEPSQWSCPPNHQPGCIRDAFESKSGPKFGSLMQVEEARKVLGNAALPESLLDRSVRSASNV